ncbi:TPA: hypothetical protein HA242_06080 [Candidatus Woesearchaeota archaeon]|nr:hypothetical protein [Candidatus Woesearchaeota archaeon]
MVMVPVLQEKITPFLQEKGISFSEFTNIISFPSKITLVAQERRDILTIASQIGNFNQYRKFFEEHTPQESIIFLQEHDKKILQDIEEHSKKYIWILKMLLAGDNYTAEKVIERLQVMICNNPQQKLTEMAIKMENQLDNLHQLCNEFPLEIQNDIVLFQEVLYFREVRLMWINEGCHYSALLLEEIAQRLDLTYEEVIYLLPDEIENGLNNQFKVPQEEIQKRLDKYAMILENNQITLYTGDEVEKHRVKSNVKNFNDVQGYPASQGKVQGIVRLVKDRSELHKVQKGDILVTKLTTPDFVVAMEKAAAIVTDLGGITSHAAIVSRELGVPCIVGTEVATQVFKDGDKVDVDAFTGIVRKIIGED